MIGTVAWRHTGEPRIVYLYAYKRHPASMSQVWIWWNIQYRKNRILFYLRQKSQKSRNDYFCKIFLAVKTA